MKLGDMIQSDRTWNGQHSLRNGMLVDVASYSGNAGAGGNRANGAALVGAPKFVP